MKSAALMLVLAFGLPMASAGKATKNPLGEVIELLDSLAAKIIQEGEDELKAYKAYVEWCDDFSKNKNFEIETATSKSEKLGAQINELTADIQTSTAKIEDLAGNIATDESDLKDATVVFEKEAASFPAK